jgi:hypothetical protein
MNMEDKFQIAPDSNELKQFGLTMGVVIVGIFGLILPWLFNQTYPLWPWLLAALFIVWSYVSPRTLKHIYFLWMRFGLVMNRITTPLLLGIVFYLIITPMGLVMRLFGRDAMQLKSASDMQSYRRQSQCREKETLERPF